MNQAKYDALTPELKAVIDKNSGLQLSGAMGKRWDESLEPSKKASVAKGSQVYVLPAAEVDQWIKATESVAVEWVADIEKRNLPAKAMMTDAKALLAKYKK
jgi:TRAP-type C4-dicarboxylate transport system substrate-binding protein